MSDVWEEALGPGVSGRRWGMERRPGYWVGDDGFDSEGLCACCLECGWINGGRGAVAYAGAGKLWCTMCKGQARVGYSPNFRPQRISAGLHEAVACGSEG